MVPEHYVPKIVWNKSNDRGIITLDLKTSIRIYNRLRFQGALWDERNRLIVGSNKLLLDICKKYNIADHGICLTFRIMNSLYRCETVKDKAKLLWMSYFNHSWKTRAEYFEILVADDVSHKFKEPRVNKFQGSWFGLWNCS